MELGQKFADFVTGLRFEQVDPRDLETAKQSILDFLGVALAGVGELPEQILWSRVSRCSSDEASVIGQTQKTTSWLAALVNGTLGHSLDFDDTAGFGHASVIIVPALLACGERAQSTGKELLTAYVAAFEVGFALNSLTRRGEDEHHGMHATGIFGPITSATAAGKIAGLDGETMRQAWGIAVSQSAGVTGNFGTHTKPLHAGLASQAGVLAAELAAGGFTSNPNAFDAPLGFMYSVVAPAYFPEIDFSKALDALGQNNLSSSLSFKKYPCGFIAQGAIDAALKLRSQLPRGADEITSIKVRVPMLESFFRVSPTGDVAGKFSYQYTAACALLDGQVTKWSFSDEAFQRPELKGLLDSFSVEVDAESGPHGILSVEAGGQELVQQIELPTGHASRPISTEEIRQKFMLNAEPVLGSQHAGEIASMVLDLENLPNLAALMDRLATRN